jgi:hypothetical protein
MKAMRSELAKAMLRDPAARKALVAVSSKRSVTFQFRGKTYTAAVGATNDLEVNR